jgi:hypothetical protein
MYNDILDFDNVVMCRQKRCSLGNYAYKTEQIRSDLKLFTKFGQDNFRGVAKQCFD